MTTSSSVKAGGMTDKEYERYEERLKNEKNLKKRQRRFLEADMKFKEQTGVEPATQPRRSKSPTARNKKT